MRARGWLLVLFALLGSMTAGGGRSFAQSPLGIQRGDSTKGRQQTKGPLLPDTGQRKNAGTDSLLALLAGRRGDSLIDAQHPAYFVGLFEQTNHGNEYPIFQGWVRRDYPETWTNAPVAEIDRSSRIVIRFNRRSIVARHKVLNGDISITGFLTKPDGSKPPIEIPGYSEIGQQARSAPVTIRNGIDLYRTLLELSRVAQSLTAQIADTGTRIVASGLKPDQAKGLLLYVDSSLLIRSWIDSISNLTLNLRPSINTVSDSVASVRGVGDTVTPARLLRQLSDSSTRLAAQRDSYRKQLARVDSIRTVLQAGVALAASASQSVSDSVRRLRAERASILNAASTLSLILRKISEPTDTIPLAVLSDQLSRARDSRKFARDPGVLKAEAHLVLEAIDSIRIRSAFDNNPQVRDSLVAEILRLGTALADLTQLGDFLLAPEQDGIEDSLARDFTSFLKDSYLSVHETGAEPGDLITIVVASTAQPGDLPRKLTLNLTVRDFGFVGHLSDSFLFIERQQIYPTTAPGAGVTDTIPAPYSFIPTAGMTFGWTLYYRRQWPLSTPIRWLQPGLGLNVSFPRFGSIVRQTPASGAGGQPTSSSIQPTQFDLAVGVALTFFDGALQLSWGRDLTVGPQRPKYFGIGFSFIKTIGDVNKITGTAQ